MGKPIRQIPTMWAGLSALFKQEISDRVKQVDPSETQDWYSITLGWAIAKGMNPEEAHQFSTWIRYNTDLA